jgi:hypothetical protein
MAAGLTVWIAVTNGRDAALVLRKLRRLGMRSIMADYRWEREAFALRPGNPHSAVTVFSATYPCTFRIQELNRFRHIAQEKANWITAMRPRMAEQAVDMR